MSDKNLVHIDPDESYPDYLVITPDESSYYERANAYLTDEEFAFVDKARGDYVKAQSILERAYERGLE